MKILIIEDNKELANSMEFYLEGENYICECAYSYNEALERLTFNSYDCILLDIMLPDGNGLNILNYIKTEKINSGILIISAKKRLRRQNRRTGKRRRRLHHKTFPLTGTTCEIKSRLPKEKNGRLQRSEIQ